MQSIRPKVYVFYILPYLTALAGFRKLKAVFSVENGTITPANGSPISDGGKVGMGLKEKKTLLQKVTN